MRSKTKACEGSDNLRKTIIMGLYRVEGYIGFRVV